MRCNNERHAVKERGTPDMEMPGNETIDGIEGEVEGSDATPEILARKTDTD